MLLVEDYEGQLKRNGDKEDEHGQWLKTTSGSKRRTGKKRKKRTVTEKKTGKKKERIFATGSGIFQNPRKKGRT